MVNPYLTPARVLNHPQPEQEGQVVLWEGRILKQSTYQGKSQLLLGTPAGNISVSCKAEVQEAPKTKPAQIAAKIG